MRPKRPMAKKGRTSVPPTLVSPARVPAPVAVARVTSQGRRPSGVAIPVIDREDEPMQQVVRSPPSSWGRREGAKASEARSPRQQEGSSASPKVDSARKFIPAHAPSSQRNITLTLSQAHPLQKPPR
jgi:hypothetical protein